MKIKADEIVSLLKKEIEEYAPQLEVDEVGSILEVGDGIARIFGLRNVMFAEMLEFEGDVFGIALNLEESSVGAVLLGDYTSLREGQTVKRTKRVMSIPVGDGMVGRVVNPLGEPLDAKGPIAADGRRPLEIIAPGIAERQPVSEPLQTGIKAIDSMVPIGRGQRELIIGDRQTGKTAIAVDTIINQKHSDVICVYVAVGQKASTVANVVARLQDAGAMDYTVVVQSSASDPAPMQYIAPYAGCAIAEYFMYTQGKATLVVYDDLTKQAAAYRELSLLLRRPPGREAYPGDVFYLHSRLLERSVKMKDKWVVCKKADKETPAVGADGKVYDRDDGEEVAKLVIKGFSKDHHVIRELDKEHAAVADVGKFAITESKTWVPLQNMVFKSKADAEKAFKGMDKADDYEVRKVHPSGGSLTALPIIETQEGEVSAYIPTNVISITDGQIYLEPNLFFSGIRPAINVGISVSRVGGSAQIKGMKGVAKSLRLDLASYWDLEAFAQLGTELDATTKAKLERGKRMVELLKQAQYEPRRVEDQIMMIFAGNEGILDQVDASEVLAFEKAFLNYVHATHNEIPKAIRESRNLSDDNAKNLLGVMEDFLKSYKAGNVTPDPRTPVKKDEDKAEAKAAAKAEEKKA